MGVRRFRKKPVEVEAIQFTDKSKNEVFGWVTCQKTASFDMENKPVLVIKTLEGQMTAMMGDWVIKGIKGEFYPCKPDIFERSYDKIS